MFSWLKSRLGIKLTARNRPEEIYLYPEKLTKGQRPSGPHSKKQVIKNIQHPTLRIWLPQEVLNTGMAIIIAPGGGHRQLWIRHEGHEVAQTFSKLGIASFVLKYRLSQEQEQNHCLEDSIADMKKSIRILRQNAERWKIDPHRIGLIGFSAGGDLASLTAMDPDDESTRPDFIVLVYASQPRLLKPSPSAPPLFILAGAEDHPIVEESVELYNSFKKATLTSHLHVIPETGHGFGIREFNSPDIARWPALVKYWLLSLPWAKPGSKY
jgi:endo-1,4-beta-xylanase